MRIDGWNSVQNSSVYSNRERIKAAEKENETEPVCDTVEITLREETKSATNPGTEEELSLLRRFEQRWKQLCQKSIAFLLKRGLLKTDEVDPKRIQFNPYCVAQMWKDFQNWAFFQKVKYRVQAIGGALVKWFSEFMGGSFFSKKEETQEDVREKERIEEETPKLQEGTKDESTLLTSYNRKGEYTQLTIRK